MKFFKKFLAALIAVVMALGIFAFAACGDGNTGNDGGNGDDEGAGGNSGTTLTTAQFLTALNTQQVKQLEMVASSSTKAYNQGMAIETAKSGLDAKFNLTAKSGDIEIYSAAFNGTELEYDYDYTFIRDGYVFTNVAYAGIAKDKVEPADYSSIVLNYSESTSVLDGVDLTDLTPALISNANYVLAKFADAAGALTIENGKATVDVNKAVYNVVQDVKEVVNGLTEETTLGDILANEKIKTYLSVFTELVPARLVSSGLEKLPELMEMLNSLTQEEIMVQFGDMATYVLMAQAILNGVSFDGLAAIIPDDGSTTYDYLVKLLGSDSLRDIVNTVLVNYMTIMGGGNGGDNEQVSALADGEEEVEGLLPNLTNISVGFLLGMVNAGKPDDQKLDLATFKTDFEAMTANVTEEGFYFAMPSFGSAEGGDTDYDNDDNYGMDMQSESEADEPMLAYVSGVKVEFTLGGGAVTGQQVSASVAYDFDEVEIVTEYNAAITYTSVEYQFADLSDNTVWYMPENYQTGTTVTFHQFVEIRDEYGYYGGTWLTYTVDFIDGVANPDTVKVYAVDSIDSVRYKLDPATEIKADTDGYYTVEIYAPVLDGDNGPVYDENNLPIYDKTKTKNATFKFEVTAGGIVDQDYLDSLDYQYDWDCIGEMYVEAIGTYSNGPYFELGGIGGQLSGKVSDLLMHLKAQASQPNA